MNNKGADQTARSDCADAQAGLRLCCSQTSIDRFSGLDAHFVSASNEGYDERAHLHRLV